MRSFVIENTIALNFRPAGKGFAEVKSRRLFLLKNTATASSEDRCLSPSPSSTRRRTSTAFRNSLDPSPFTRRLASPPPSPHDRLKSLHANTMATVAVATPSKEINPLLAGASPLSCNRPPLKGAGTRSLLTRGSWEHSLPPVARDAPDAHQVFDFGILVVRLSCSG